MKCFVILLSLVDIPGLFIFLVQHFSLLRVPSIETSRSFYERHNVHYLEVSVN
jgi:hypothetical protein